MNRITRTILYMAGTLPALFLYCNSPADHSGNSSQLGNGKTEAMLYNADGTPAKGATVVFIPVDYTLQPGLNKTAAATICTTVTDDDGIYRFASVSGGTYNIFGASENGLSFQDSVPVAAGVAEVEPDTLRLPGTIRGFVKLTNGLDHKTIYLLIPGSMVFSPVDSNGLFVLADMAEGRYSVRFFTLLDDWEPKDTLLTVISGTDTLLPDSIELRFKGVPSPTGLVVGYDTLHESVVLKWDAPDTALVDGINIYRAVKGENFSLLTMVLLPETTTTYIDRDITVGASYEYRIVARNRAGEESKLLDITADTVTTALSCLVKTTIVWGTTTMLSDEVSVGDTVGVIVAYANPTRLIRMVKWYNGEDTGESTVPVREKTLSSLSGSDTLNCRWDSPGTKEVIVRIFDEAGMEWTDRFMARVLQDAPVADAGNDTTVSVNDSFFVNYSGKDVFGAVVKYRLDLDGDGTFDDSSSVGGRKTGIASSQAGDVRIIVQVEDDDGNVDSDTMMVHVMQDVPVADAGKDTTVSINDSFFVYFSGKDTYGTIQKYRLDIDGDGTFDDSSNASGRQTAFAPTHAGDMKIVVQGVDDDGNIDNDTMVVHVVLDPPRVNAGNDITIAIDTAVTFKGIADQQFGRILQYKWDFEADGIWEDSSLTTGTATTTYNTCGLKTAILGALDDDGNFMSDTVNVNVVMYLSGTLFNDQTLLKSKSPYMINGDLQIAEGAMLTIEAGVKVNYMNSYKILVKGGSIVANGTLNDSIYFSPPILFESTDLSNSHLSYTVFQNGAEAIYLGKVEPINSGVLTISSARFSGTTITAGGDERTQSRLVLTNAQIESSTIQGACGPIEIINSRITNSTIWSKDLNNNGINIYGCIVATTKFAISCYASNITVDSSTISNSSVVHTDYRGILTIISSTLTNTPIDLTYGTVNISGSTLNNGKVQFLTGAIKRTSFIGNNSGVGIEIEKEFSGSLSIDSSTIRNFDVGLKVMNADSIILTNTNFYDNSTYHIQNMASKGIAAPNCYWGIMTGNEIQAKIFDYYDDISYGKVSYNPFLLTKITF